MNTPLYCVFYAPTLEQTGWPIDDWPVGNFPTLKAAQDAVAQEIADNDLQPTDFIIATIQIIP